MTLYLIGLGLYDEKDISIRGFEAIESCDTIYLEHYTSILSIDKDKLEAFYGSPVTLAPRNLVESQAEELLLKPAKEKNVALLVVGDVFGATTHTDLMLRAKEMGVEVEVIFNASVMNAIGITGLELYKFGKTTSIVFPDDNWLPQTPYDVIKQNKESGLHTLCLLDIKVAEPSKEDLRRAQTADTPSLVPQDPRFMTVKEGLNVLQRIEQERKENIISDDTLCIGIARLGHPDMKIVAASFKELINIDFGEPLHAIIIPGNLQAVEEEALVLYRK